MSSDVSDEQCQFIFSPSDLVSTWQMCLGWRFVASPSQLQCCSSTDLAPERPKSRLPLSSISHGSHLSASSLSRVPRCRPPATCPALSAFPLVGISSLWSMDFTFPHSSLPVQLFPLPLTLLSPGTRGRGQAFYCHWSFLPLLGQVLPSGMLPFQLSHLYNQSTSWQQKSLITSKINSPRSFYQIWFTDLSLLPSGCLLICSLSIRFCYTRVEHCHHLSVFPLI